MSLKPIKILQKKAEDLVKLVRDNCAISSLNTPQYGIKQGQQIATWIQAHKDILTEIATLRLRIAKTNLETMVDIRMDNGTLVTKSLAYWIHRKRELAGLELSMWSALTDRDIKEGVFAAQGRVAGQDQDKVEVKIVRFYEPAQRDAKKMSLYAEPTLIDSTLEIVNAVTDLLEI